MPLIRKSISIAPENVDVKAGIISGYFAAFGNVDAHGDRFMPGAFTKSIIERGVKGTGQIKHLLQHDTWRPMGVLTELKEDTFGLKFATKATIGIGYVDDTLRLYAAGVYNEHSVGFRIISEKFNDDDRANEIFEVKLWEGSTVTWGANDHTPFLGYKAVGDAYHLDSLIKRAGIAQNALKVGGLTDETYQGFELFLASIQSELQSIKYITAGSRSHHPKGPEQDDTTGSQFLKRLGMACSKS